MPVIAPTILPSPTSLSTRVDSFPTTCPTVSMTPPTSIDPNSQSFVKTNDDFSIKTFTSSVFFGSDRYFNRAKKSAFAISFCTKPATGARNPDKNPKKPFFIPRAPFRRPFGFPLFNVLVYSPVGSLPFSTLLPSCLSSAALSRSLCSFLRCLFSISVSVLLNALLIFVMSFNVFAKL